MQTSKELATGSWVIDAFVTMPWFFPDEVTASTEGLLDALSAQPLWAPALWVLECATVLQSVQRRGRIDSNRRVEIAGELDALPVRVDNEPLAVSAFDRLGATHGLSAYDAAYIDLALRCFLTRVSLEARLVTATKALGHPVLTAATA